MKINYYSSYFHDGDVIDIKRDRYSLVILMQSSQIAPADMTDDIPLSNFSTLRGKLHLVNVSSIKIDGRPCDMVEMQTDRGDIYDLQIQDRSVRMLIAWMDDTRHLSNNRDMIEYHVEAENVFWENLPHLQLANEISFNKLGSCLNQAYILEVKVTDDSIAFLVESTIRDSCHQLEGIRLTAENTLCGRLLLQWVESVDIGAQVISLNDLRGSTGVLQNIDIGYHHVHISIKSAASEEPLAFDFKVGSIDWQYRPDRRRL